MKVEWDKRWARRTRRMMGSAIRELLRVTEQPGFISFGGGLPAPECFPIAEIAQVAGRLLREAGPTALQYSGTEGYRPLREVIAERMRDEGVSISSENVLITTGSQQGIDLVGKVLLDPNDPVVVESPTYLAALQAWNAYEANFITVPSDDEGMDTRRLEQLVTGRPKLVYCVPNFQNPRGVTLSGERREQLVDVSFRRGIAIVEDDPYRDLRFEGSHLPRIIGLDARRQSGSAEYCGNVISLGSFSKVLAPGLRVGWVIATPQVIAQLSQAKQATDLHTSTLDQMIAYEMLRSGYLEVHKRTIVQTYRERRDTMLRALERYFPAGLRWTHPEGGMFMWVELPQAIDAADLLREVMQDHVAFVPGQGFHVDGGGHNTLRLNYSNARPDQIEEGIRRLASALERVHLESKGGTVHGIRCPAWHNGRHDTPGGPMDRVCRFVA